MYKLTMGFCRGVKTWATGRQKGMTDLGLLQGCEETEEAGYCLQPHHTLLPLALNTTSSSTSLISVSISCSPLALGLGLALAPLVANLQPGWKYIPLHPLLPACSRMPAQKHAAQRGNGLGITQQKAIAGPKLLE